MSGFLESLRQFWASYGSWITVALIPTLITGLSLSPKTAPAAAAIQRVWDFIKQILSYFSFATFKNEAGTFQLPIIGGVKMTQKLKSERRMLKEMQQKKRDLDPPGGVMALVLVFIALANQGCCTWTGTCTDKAGQIGTEVVDCGQAALSTTILNLVPTVLAIVTGGAPNWSAQLDALAGVGKDALSCALAVVMRQIQDALMTPKAVDSEEDLKERAKAAVAVEKGKSYLLQRNIKTTNVP